LHFYSGSYTHTQDLVANDLTGLLKTAAHLLDIMTTADGSTIIVVMMKLTSRTAEGAGIISGR